MPNTALDAMLDDVNRELHTLNSYLVEADIALTKAAEHVAKRVPLSGLTSHITKMRDAVRATSVTLSQESERILGRLKVDA